MGPLLAIDAGVPGASAAVLDRDGRVLASQGGAERADMLVPLIEAALAEARVRPADLGAIAVAVGPGSFTGVRAAVAAAKGLSLALRLDVHPVGTLSALAWAARDPVRERPFVAVVPAGRGEVYAQSFDAQGKPVGDPAALDPAAIEARLVVGPAADAVVAAAPGQIEAVSLAHDARHVGAVALDGVAAVSGFEIAPVYLRPADAKPAAGRSLIALGVV